MSRAKVTLLTAISLVLGLVVGAVGGVWYSSRTFVGLGGISAAAGVSTKVRMLEGFRSADQARAIEMLESLLDSDLLTVDALLREEADFAETSLLNSLRLAKEYRSTFQRSTGNVELDQAIQSALSRAPNPK